MYEINYNKKINIAFVRINKVEKNLLVTQLRLILPSLYFTEVEILNIFSFLKFSKIDHYVWQLKKWLEIFTSASIAVSRIWYTSIKNLNAVIEQFREASVYNPSERPEGKGRRVVRSVLFLSLRIWQRIIIIYFNFFIAKYLIYVIMDLWCIFRYFFTFIT